MRRLVVLPFIIVFAWLVILTLQSLPYDQAWDMDFITSMDLFQMAQGILPQHINHTGMGLYLIQRWLWYWGDLSATNLSQMLASPIPLLLVAEATVWVRSLTVIPATLAVSGCIAGMIFLIHKSRWVLFIVIAAVVSTWAGLWGLHVKMVRTEMYAIAYYSLAFALLPLLKTKHSFRWFVVIFFIAGVGFLTKFQGFFLHAALLLLAWQCLDPKEIPSLPLKRSFAWVMLLIFLGISMLSWLSYIPTYFAQFATKKRPNLFFFVNLAILLLPFIGIKLAQLFHSIEKFRSPKFYRHISPHAELLRNLSVPYWVTICLLAGFICHFFMGFSFGNSLEYLFFDWRMIFLKVSDHNTPSAAFITQFLWNTKFHLLPLVVWSVLAKLSWSSLPRRRQVFVGLHALIVVVSLAFASRGRVQDSIWNEVLIWWGFAYFVPQIEKLQLKWIIPIGAALVVWNITHFKIPSLNRKKNYNPRPVARFWREPYESPLNGFTQTMRKSLNDPYLFQEMNRLSHIHKELKVAMKELWPGDRPDLRHLSVPRARFRNFVVITPIAQESFIKPGRFNIWLGSEDLENYTDCPLTPKILREGTIRWRQVVPRTKKCRVLSAKVDVALDYTPLLSK